MVIPCPITIILIVLRVGLGPPLRREGRGLPAERSPPQTHPVSSPPPPFPGSKQGSVQHDPLPIALTPSIDAWQERQWRLRLRTRPPTRP